MHRVGYGLYQIPASEAKAATLAAVSVGYRTFDSASFYGNEKEVGEALRECGVPRSELFIATKVWTDCIGARKVRESVLKSLELLKIDYCDLAYVHWPCDGHVEAYGELEKLCDMGAVRNIGLSNYRKEDYEALKNVRIQPLVNQIEVNPWMYRKDAISYFVERGIGIVAYKPLLRGAGMDKDDPKLLAISEKHSVSIAQVLLRWATQHGFYVIPKSTNLGRMRENLDIFHFDLDQHDLDYLDSLSTDVSAFQTHFAKRAVVDKDGPTLELYGGS